MAECVVDKLQTMKCICDTDEYIKLTEEYLKGINNLEYYKHKHWDLDRILKDEKEKLEILEKQLDCKHIETEEIEDYNYHRGYSNYNVTCKKCGFIVKRY